MTNSEKKSKLADTLKQLRIAHRNLTDAYNLLGEIITGEAMAYAPDDEIIALSDVFNDIEDMIKMLDKNSLDVADALLLPFEFENGSVDLIEEIDTEIY